MKKQLIKKNKGFTLVETLFAVFILTFTIASLMTVVANNLFAAKYARDEITVNYLLQEVVDYIRNDRDTTVFLGNGTTWNDFVLKYENCSGSNGCYLDVLEALKEINLATINTEPCSISDGCLFLYYNKDADITSGSFYNYNTNNVQTNFRRKIIVKPDILNPDEIDVTVTIDWKNGGKNMTRSLSTNLMKWQ